jgi:hypothetical protein
MKLIVKYQGKFYLGDLCLDGKLNFFLDEKEVRYYTIFNEQNLRSIRVA